MNNMPQKRAVNMSESFEDRWWSDKAPFNWPAFLPGITSLDFLFGVNKK